jgi:hypothetical protein
VLNYVGILPFSLIGGAREPHSVLSAPLALSANVFTSLPRSQFTVNGFKMSTHLSTAPHQSRKKRELTGAVELLKYKYGGERDRHTIVLYNPIFYSTLPCTTYHSWI